MKKQKGFNLIELMIALLIGMIIVAATITIYISTIRSSSDIVKSARLNHDLDSALALMVNDIRRAGYWGRAMVGSDGRDNPFTQAATNLKLLPSSPYSCILYTYDEDADGNVDSDEYYGFKLNGSDIQMRLTGSSINNCNHNSDVWRTLNVNEGSEEIDVTSLTFTPSYKCLRKRTGAADVNFDTSCEDAAATAGNLLRDDRVIESREIIITLSGRVKTDTAVTKNLTNRVKIRNDRVFTQP